MRRFAIFTAGAALVVGSLAIPGMAVANSRTASPEKSTTISAQSVSLDTPIAAQGKGHGKGGHRNGYRRGYRHGYGDSRHGHYRHGYNRGGRCYGCDGPGSRCDRYGCGYGGPGYYGGGYGCGYDYDVASRTSTTARGTPGRTASPPRIRSASTTRSATATTTRRAAVRLARGQASRCAEPAPGQGGEQPRPY